MAGREARSRSQKPLQSGFWLKPDPSAAFEAAEAAPRSRARSRLLTSPNVLSKIQDREAVSSLEFAVSVTYSRAEETQNQIFISADDELKALHRLLFELFNGTWVDRCVFCGK
jgi:hypothetical protein